MSMTQTTNLSESTAARASKPMRCCCESLQFEGFRDYPDCFLVDEYKVDEDAWSEGFVTVTTDG